MSSSKTPETPKTPTERIDVARGQLKSLRRHFQLASWLTVIVGFGLLGLVAFYFIFGYTKISSFRDPNMIVFLVGQMVDDGIPQVRQRVESEIDNNADVWAEQASQQLVLWMPSARQGLEEYVCQQAEIAIDQADVVGEREFRRLIEENRAAVSQAIQDLKNDKEISDGAVAMLEEAIQKEFEMNTETQAAAVLGVVQGANENMKQILRNEDLTPRQIAERRVLMLAKRLQQERFPDVRLDELAPAGLKDSVEEMERARLEKKASAAGEDDAQASAAEAAKPASSDKQAPKDEKPAEPAPESVAAAEPDKPAEAEKPKEEKPAAPAAKEATPASEPKAEAPKPDAAEAKSKDAPKADTPKSDAAEAKSKDAPKAQEKAGDSSGEKKADSEK